MADTLTSELPISTAQTRTAADGSYVLDLRPGKPYAIFVADTEWAARDKHIYVRPGEPQTDVDLTLERGVLLSGRVTAGEPPQPVAGTAVTLVTPMPDVFLSDGKRKLPTRHAPVRVTDTDHDGHYTFRVFPGTYTLSGPDPPGGAAAPRSLSLPNAIDIQRDFSLSHLWLPRRTLRGAVRARQPDGPPVGRAIVVNIPIESDILPSQLFADGDGRFEVPRPYRKVLLYARDPSGDVAGVMVVTDETDSDVTLVARPAAIAYGRVVDGKGMPYDTVRVCCALIARRSAPTASKAPPSGPSPMRRADLPCRASHRNWRGQVYATRPGGGVSRKTNVDVTDAQPINVGDVVMHPR